MGSPDGNSSGWSPDGGMPDNLPELPAEWHIVIPDDVSALAREVDEVRAELRRERRKTRWRWIAGPPSRTPELRAPLLIMAVAVLVTLASLFTAAWPGVVRPPTVQRTANSSPGRELPALDLIGHDGRAVALRSFLPAVILLVDGCDCDGLAAATAAAVSSGTSVLAVTAGPAPSAASPAPIRNVAIVRLHDPTSQLRQHYQLPAPDGTAAALLVRKDGSVVRTVQRTASIEDLRPDLGRLRT